MKFRDFLASWGLTSLSINAGFLEAEFSVDSQDRAAAWELYIELLTRTTTQDLTPEQGDEKTALDSVYALFAVTRDILKRHGAGCGAFAKLAIPVLNQVIRPFTTKWHRLSLAGALAEPAQARVFREELSRLQVQLRHYTQALAAMAGVEDLTKLEQS